MKTLTVLCVLLVSSAWAVPLVGVRVVPAEEVCAATRDLVQRAAAAGGLSADVQCPQARPIGVPNSMGSPWASPWNGCQPTNSA